MSGGAISKVLPIAGAAAGLMIPGLGPVAGMALGAAAGGLVGGNEQQPMQPGVIPEQGPMLPGQTRNPATGAIEQGMPQMVLPPSNGGKAAQIMQSLSLIGEMQKSAKDRELTDAQIQQALYRAPVMPRDVSAGGMGSYGPQGGMRYI